MTKEKMMFLSMVAIAMNFGMTPARGEQSGAGGPDPEFALLSETVSTASLPETAAPAAPSAAQLTPGGMESLGTNKAAPVATSTGIVEAVKSVEGAVSSNSMTASDGTTDVVSVAHFPDKAVRENLISVALDDVALQDVVRLFTKISGANIIATSSNLQGKVTVNLQDVEWKPALDSILDIYSMMVVEKVPGSNIYSIMPKAPGAAEPLIAQPIFLDYAPVSNVVAAIKPMAGNDGMISPFPNANAIVVRASAANLSAILKVVKEIDVPRQQVYIEAKFMELTDEAIKDLGINWQMLEGYNVGVATLSQTMLDERSKFNGQRTGLGTVDSDLRSKGASGAGLPGSGATDNRSLNQTIQSGSSASLSDSTKDGVSSSSGKTAGNNSSETISKSQNFSHESENIKGQHVSDIRTAVLSADDFKLVLSALQQVNGISIVSNPKIIVANQETATIHIGDKEPNIKGTVTPGQQGQANTTTYALDDRTPYFEYGISLDVTPTINNQSNVMVRIAPTLSRFLRNKTAPDNNTYPVTSAKTITTSFSLESGKTAAIGGLTETDERDNVVKVPFLGDIPLIGKYLFTHTHKKRTQTETIIFVTVGLASSRSVTSNEGLPQETVLTQKHLAAKKAAVDKGDDKKSALEKLSLP